MKKRIIILAIVMVVLTGCSRSATSDTSGYDSDYVEALESKVAELEATNETLRNQLMYYSGLVNSSGSNTYTEQPVQEESETQYTCSDEVYRSRPEDGLMQVDDVVFSIGYTETLADVVAAFEQKGYTTDYYPRQKGSTIKTTVYKNQIPYIVLYASSIKLNSAEPLRDFVEHGGSVYLFSGDEARNMLVEKAELTSESEHNTFFFGGYKADGSNCLLDEVYSELETIANMSEQNTLGSVSTGNIPNSEINAYCFTCDSRIISKNDPYPAELLKYLPKAHEIKYSFYFDKINQKGEKISLDYYRSEGWDLERNDVVGILKDFFGVDVTN